MHLVSAYTVLLVSAIFSSNFLDKFGKFLEDFRHHQTDKQGDQGEDDHGRHGAILHKVMIRFDRVAMTPPATLMTLTTAVTRT
jgi:hypothetical protein